MKPLKIGCFGFISLVFLLLLSFFPRSVFADDCGYEVPSAAPDLYQVSASSSSATLYFAQPNTTFDGYIISYGLTESADAYSVTFPMGYLNGAVKYKVNDLFPKTNYFFKVRAVNGCAAGPWSATKSTNIKNASSLPEAGPSNAIIGLGIGGVILALIGIGLLFIF
jgi:hypothetical protein